MARHFWKRTISAFLLVACLGQITASSAPISNSQANS
jgi:hypothetical protein